MQIKLERGYNPMSQVQRDRVQTDITAAYRRAGGRDCDMVGTGFLVAGAALVAAGVAAWGRFHANRATK